MGSRHSEGDGCNGCSSAWNDVCDEVVGGVPTALELGIELNNKLHGRAR